MSEIFIKNILNQNSVKNKIVLIKKLLLKFNMLSIILIFLLVSTRETINIGILITLIRLKRRNLYKKEENNREKEKKREDLRNKRKDKIGRSIKCKKWKKTENCKNKEKNKRNLALKRNFKI